MNKATVALIVGALASILVQLAGRHGIVLDPASANALTMALVTLALGSAGSHTVDSHAEAHADAAVAVAQLNNAAVAGSAQVAPKDPRA